MTYITFEEVKDILKQSIDITTNMNEALEKTVQSIYLKGYNDAKREYSEELEERRMTRFSNFTDEELDAMEWVFCNEGLSYFDLINEIRRERRYRKVESEE